MQLSSSGPCHSQNLESVAEFPVLFQSKLQLKKKDQALLLPSDLFIGKGAAFSAEEQSLSSVKIQESEIEGFLINRDWVAAVTETETRTTHTQSKRRVFQCRVEQIGQVKRSNGRTRGEQHSITQRLILLKLIQRKESTVM